ncbi:hypothetical protein IV102_18040 [bacterium]|nr:hypothetical protein [bacterium]
MNLWLWRLSAVLTFWSFGFYRLQGGDLFWHVATGRLLLERQGMVYQDPWSFSQPNADWIQHEWLSDILYAGLEQTFGMSILVYWKWAMVVTIYLILFELLRRRTQDPLASYLGCLAALALGGPFLDFRPHLYSMLGYVLLLAICLGRRQPPWLPLLFVVWSNLHGGVMFGLMVVGLLTLTQRNSPRIAVACGLAALLNAAGPGALGYCFKYAFNPNSPYLTLCEWRSPFAEGSLPNPLYPLALTVLGASVVLIFLRPDLRQQFFDAPGGGLASLALACLTMAMSLRSGRFTPFFGITLALLVAPCCAWLLAGRHGRRAVWLALVYGVWQLSAYPLSRSAFPFLVREQNFPVDTVNFLEANGWRGKVFNYYGWGGYLHFRTRGGLLVFSDQRADTVFSEAVFQRYLDVLRGQPGWIQRVEESGAEAFLWPREDKHAAELIATRRWRLVHEDSVSVLLLRTGVVTSSRVGPTTGYRHFALASEAANAGRLEEAEMHTRMAVEMAPHLEKAWLSLVALQLARGERQTARETLLKANEFFPLPIYRGFLGRLERRQVGGAARTI